MRIDGVSQLIQETPQWARDALTGLVGGAILIAAVLPFLPHLSPPSSPPVTAVAATPESAFQALLARNAVEAQAGPTGAPLLWVVRNKSATVYLFGSVHVLRSNLNWMDPRLFHAFDSADEAWFEVPDLNARPSANLPARSAWAPVPVLARGLDAAEKADLGKFLAPYGYTLASAGRIQPWAMAQALTSTDQRAMGFNFARGADMTLFLRAHDLNKPVHGFETPDQQMAYLAEMSSHSPVDGAQQLKSALAAHAGRMTAGDDINVVAHYWRTGDEKGLLDGVAHDRKLWGEAGYKVLISDRNRNWVPKIEGLLNGKKTVFVTVGAAHLVGPDGVISHLRQDGWDVERVDP